jgi:hypothetical protein
VNGSNNNIRIVIPLTLRRRNGRPKILPPENVADQQVRTQAPHILKALGRAWAWRRKLESGELATVSDLANAENVTDRFVSRTMRLAFLSPEVLHHLLIERQPPSLAVNILINTCSLPWGAQLSIALSIPIRSQ